MKRCFDSKVEQKQKEPSMCDGSLAAAHLFRLISLLLFAQYDADEISLMLLHVLHQLLFTGGLEATDTAAEKQHTIFHTWP